MKITNALVELETVGIAGIVIRIRPTKAEIAVTGEEAIELWKVLDMLYGEQFREQQQGR